MVLTARVTNMGGGMVTETRGGDPDKISNARVCARLLVTDGVSLRDF